MIYLLTAIGLSPGGSTHLHTNNTQNNTNNRTTQITNNVEECWPCPVFASFTLAFALQLRKKHGKTTVRVRAYRYPPDVAFYTFFFFLTNVGTEYFKHAVHSLFFSSKCRLFHSATFFGSCIIHTLHTGCAKI
jgi:hypothetical protein